MPTKRRRSTSKRHEPWDGVARPIAIMEHTVGELPESVVLRYGLFYGPGTAFDRDGRTAERVQRSADAGQRERRLVPPHRGRRDQRPTGARLAGRDLQHRRRRAGGNVGLAPPIRRRDRRAATAPDGRARSAPEPWSHQPESPPRAGLDPAPSQLAGRVRRRSGSSSSRSRAMNCEDRSDQPADGRVRIKTASESSSRTSAQAAGIPRPARSSRRAGS